MKQNTPLKQILFNIYLYIAFTVTVLLVFAYMIEKDVVSVLTVPDLVLVCMFFSAISVVIINQRKKSNPKSIFISCIFVIISLSVMSIVANRDCYHIQQILKNCFALICGTVLSFILVKIIANRR